jgi:microcystin-dependent protein
VVLTLDQLGAHDHGIPGGTTGVTGSGLPVNNLQPSLAMNYLIATGGPFPNFGGPPFTGEINAFAGNFAPEGWTQADGRLLSISSNTALFSILGTTYGGDGVTDFALPDLRGRTAVGSGDGVSLGEDFGTEVYSLSDLNLPSHTHSLPGGGFTDPEGGGAPFDNAQPSLGINYLIALQGIFPSRDPAPFLPTSPCSARSRGLPETSRRTASPWRKASFCRSLRTPPCSPSSAPPMAGTGSPPSRFRTCVAARSSERTASSWPAT